MSYIINLAITGIHMGPHPTKTQDKKAPIFLSRLSYFLWKGILD